eukprot:CAMPEP_0178581666 /NCGR_PEP_ID=MMETSP0697-20121206/23308_1 /TAXON_ID=265572 /ORGANISM="Extubocellulus spinifer, Strain CCMP396" /LENGTH=335 /DNA_ID=CAMNT_0020217337 /DNA_START=32 /DNA_END=1038 /DNA_ORIENTATION=-
MKAYVPILLILLTIELATANIGRELSLDESLDETFDEIFDGFTERRLRDKCSDGTSSHQPNFKLDRQDIAKCSTASNCENCCETTCLDDIWKSPNCRADSCFNCWNCDCCVKKCKKEACDGGGGGEDESAAPTNAAPIAWIASKTYAKRQTNSPTNASPTSVSVLPLARKATANDAMTTSAARTATAAKAKSAVDGKCEKKDYKPTCYRKGKKGYWCSGKDDDLVCDNGKAYKVCLRDEDNCGKGKWKGWVDYYRMKKRDNAVCRGGGGGDDDDCDLWKEKCCKCAYKKCDHYDHKKSKYQYCVGDKCKSKCRKAAGYCKGNKDKYKNFAWNECA